MFACANSLCEQDAPPTTDPVQISKPALQVAKLARSGGEAFSQDLARALLAQENDIHVARARLITIRKLIDDAVQYLEARNNG